MVTTTLTIAGAVSMVTGLAFAMASRAASQRPASTSERLLARRAHALWWGSLGTYLVIQGAMTLLASVDRLTLQSYLASRLVAIPLLCVSVWGLTYFLIFLYTGRAKTALPLAVLYGLVALLFFWATFGEPQQLILGAWVVGIDDTAPIYRAVYLLVGLPPIVASLAYLALLRRIQDTEQRYRITLLAGSILLYVGGGLAARLAANDAVIFATLVFGGLGAAAASIAAYHPPRRFRSPGGGA